MRALRHARAILLLPAVVTLLVPALLSLIPASLHPGWELASPLRLLPFALGALAVAAGLAMFVWTNVLFDTVGQGTLAPWDPTERLVAGGVYRHVRNPMISGVCLILLGEAALLGSLPVLGWAGAFFLVNAVYIPLVEERDLERRFGEPYRAYKRGVPRWLPRLRAWRADAALRAGGR
jgi:protein-S-isoprenylcysteine O-methyltransferase Ste14